MASDVEHQPALEGAKYQAADSAPALITTLVHCRDAQYPYGQTQLP
jgi:hypothetical protein